uniref:Ig-like domain-containing protein n=1 Tax=Jaculus jaculus TaxID=51337 RepID=A0A8C5P5D8_JACJA
MDYLTFFLALLLMHEGLCKEVFWDTTVQLSKTMALECMHPSIDTLTQLEWVRMKGQNKENIVIFSTIYGMKESETYKDRIHFPNSTMTPVNPTLFFHNASEADVGLYSCTLYMFPFGVWTKTIQVVQSESFDKAATLNSEIVSAPGQKVTLMYELQKNWTAQQVTWERVQAQQIDVLSLCNLSQGRNYTSKYLRELWSTCSQGSRTSLLVLPGVLPTDSGIYRCRFESSTGENDTFAIRLTVTDGKSNILFVAGGTVLLLLAILIIPTIFISCRAANNYRSPTSTNGSMDDAGDEIYVNYPTFPRRQKTTV